MKQQAFHMTFPKFFTLLLVFTVGVFATGCEIEDFFFIDPQADRAVDKGKWQLCAQIKDDDAVSQDVSLDK